MKGEVILSIWWEINIKMDWSVIFSSAYDEHTRDKAVPDSIWNPKTVTPAWVTKEPKAPNLQMCSWAIEQFLIIKKKT